MKKSKSKYDGNLHGWSDGELPSVNFLNELIENVTAATYPSHILLRRINLLTPRELKIFNNHWYKIAERVEKMELILANRAEIIQDPWK